MSEWIEHDGGPCPVPAGTMVDVYIDGEILKNKPASFWFWSDESVSCGEAKDFGIGRVEKYRIHRPADVPYIPPVAEKPDGVTRRDMAAYAALTGMYSNDAWRHSSCEEMALDAYQMANAMEAARGGE